MGRRPRSGLTGALIVCWVMATARPATARPAAEPAIIVNQLVIARPVINQRAVTVPTITVPTITLPPTVRIGRPIPSPATVLHREFATV